MVLYEALHLKETKHQINERFQTCMDLTMMYMNNSCGCPQNQIVTFREIFIDIGIRMDI